MALAVVLAGATVAGCTDGPVPEGGAGEPGLRRAMLFADDFQAAEPRWWTPFAGSWAIEDVPTGSREYLAPIRSFNQSIAGSFGWTDYAVQVQVTLVEDAGMVGVLGRVQDTHHYYELLLGRADDVIGPNGNQDARSWYIRKREQHRWTTLASGHFEYELGTPFIIRLDIRGSALAGSLSLDGGGSFRPLGHATDNSLRFGKIGLASYSALSRFDDVAVYGVSPVTSALEVGPWGGIVELRDDTNRYSAGKPPGGWYVTPIHATLGASDGNVLITGFGRVAEAKCSGTTGRQVGETFVVSPAAIDAGNDGDTMFVQPIDEQALDRVHDVLYCSGHTNMADGRVYFSAGTRYPDTLPDANPELGLSYSRVYSRTTGTLSRVNAPTKGGQAATPGMKWYPTSRLLPEGGILTFGGFHWSGGGAGTKQNQSLELFDPRIWDANPMADPYTVLTQHAEGNAETPPARSYTNMFVLPRPVPSASAGGGFARAMAVSGNTGRVFLYNHEPGPTGSQRLIARAGAASVNPGATQDGGGVAAAMLPDGKIMYANGGNEALGSSQAYFYDPYSDSWGAPLPLGISRHYGNSVWLPNGTILLVGGYANEPNETGDSIPSPLGAPDGIRKAQIIDPFARTVVTQPTWPEPAGRGYHNIALLLKDGRVLIGGGKDGDHATGCEKNDLRIYSPPYLSAGPRPTITNVTSGQTLVVGGPALTIDYTETVRPTRGVVLMAPGSMTHGFDQAQRYVPLTTTSGPANGSVTVSAPATINETPPADYLLYVVSDLGVPSVGVHVRVVAPPPCWYGINGAVDSYIEAEGSSRRAPPFQQVTDATRSGGAFMQADPASASNTTVPNEGQVLWYDIDVSSGGSFFMWLLGNGPDASSDTFYVSVDGNADQSVTVPASAWGWVRAATAVNIPSGKHTMKIKARERGSQVDKLRLTKSSSTAPPAGDGATALACIGTAITGLVVSDTANGGDGVPNNTQWTVQPSFAGGGGQLAFGDRTFSIAALPAAAAHFSGKPWIRTAADSKSYQPASSQPPVVAKANIYGAFVFIAIDTRHPTTPLTNAGYINQGYSLTVNEGATPRTYNVWRRAIPAPGTNVALPSLSNAVAPFYFVIVE